MTVLVCVVREDHGLRHVLAWKPVKRIGTISYGIYLYHVVAFYFVGRFLMRLALTTPWIKFALCVVLTAAIAELSYRFFEQPLLGLKRRFR